MPFISALVCWIVIIQCGTAAAGTFGFIEFRARAGSALGHTLVAYGEATGREIHYRGSLGLYPQTDLADTPLSAILFLPGRVGRDPEDGKWRVRAVYRHYLSKKQYRDVVTTMQHARGRVHPWHLVVFNCNEFAARIAQSVGLRTPSTLQSPDSFVRDLAIVNGSAPRRGLPDDRLF